MPDEQQQPAAYTQRHKKYLPHGAAVGLMLLSRLASFTAPAEGETHVAVIPVPGDVPTICYGHTHGVHLGDVATHPECLKDLQGDERPALETVVYNVKVPMKENETVAFADFVFNSGGGNFRFGSCGRPAILPIINSGDVRGACYALLKYDQMAHHHKDGTCTFTDVRGIENRRRYELEMCLNAVQDHGLF